MGPEASTMKKTGFKYKPWPGSWDKCLPGDILVGPNYSGDATGNDCSIDHTEIFAGLDNNGNPMVYNAGSTEAITNPNATYTGASKYAILWDPDGASGTGTAVKSTSTGTSGETGISGDTGTVNNSTESTSSSSGGTVFEKITSWISQFTSKAINGLITGNWDTNYIFSDDAIETTSESNTNPDYVVPEGDNYTSFKHSNPEKHIMGFFIKNGIKPKAAAGIMGSLNGESGLNPQNVGDDVNEKKDSPILGRGKYRQTGQKIGEMELSAYLARSAKKFIDVARGDTMKEDNQLFLNNLLGLGLTVSDEKGYNQGGSSLKSKLNQMKVKFRLKNQNQ
jgi:hypothetical protein